jgi:crossover junction endodeoxyribonuclease RusA
MQRNKDELKLNNKDYVCLYLPFPPSLNRYYVKTRNGVFISKKGKEFRAETIKSINEQLGSFKTIDNNVKVGIIFHPPRAGIFDSDNYLKGLFDSITHAKVWDDDSQVSQHYAYKGEKIKNGKTIVIISDADPIIPIGGEQIVINDLFGE